MKKERRRKSLPDAIICEHRAKNFAAVLSSSHYDTNRQVASSIPDDVIEIFQRHNLSGRTMALA